MAVIDYSKNIELYENIILIQKLVANISVLENLPIAASQIMYLLLSSDASSTSIAYTLYCKVINEAGLRVIHNHSFKLNSTQQNSPIYLKELLSALLALENSYPILKFYPGINIYLVLDNSVVYFNLTSLLAKGITPSIHIMQNEKVRKVLDSFIPYFSMFKIHTFLVKTNLQLADYNSRHESSFYWKQETTDINNVSTNVQYLCNPCQDSCKIPHCINHRHEDTCVYLIKNMPTMIGPKLLKYTPGKQRTAYMEGKPIQYNLAQFDNGQVEFTPFPLKTLVEAHRIESNYPEDLDQQLQQFPLDETINQLPNFTKDSRQVFKEQAKYIRQIWERNIHTKQKPSGYLKVENSPCIASDLKLEPIHPNLFSYCTSNYERLKTLESYLILFSPL